MFLEDERVIPFFNESGLAKMAGKEDIVRVSRPTIDPEKFNFIALFNLGYDIAILAQIQSDTILLQPRMAGESLSTTVGRHIHRFGVGNVCEIYLRRSLSRPWHRICFDEFLRFRLRLDLEREESVTIMNNMYHLWKEKNISIDKLAKGYHLLFRILAKSGPFLGSHNINFDTAFRILEIYLQ